MLNALSNLFSSNIKRHNTLEGQVVYERTDNWYFVDVSESGARVIEEQPRPYVDEGVGAPITIYNSWPEKLNNVSIFHYLCDDATAGSAEFIEFVRTWYKASCAIVYKSENEIPRIIGSGSLVSRNKISTARHNFNNFHNENLFIRFFSYKVEKRGQNFLVKESYIELPVINREIAAEGLDAGFLIIPKLMDQSIFSRYAKTLACSLDGIASGKYAMFHFAEGRHQVSVGDIVLPVHGMLLTDHIQIQAGSGASGAAIIVKQLDSVLGCGVSVYREFNKTGAWVDRRIIAFCDFNKPKWIDPVSAPYSNHMQGQGVNVASTAFDESGYEFLQWFGNEFQKPRMEKPNNPHYRVNVAHSVHHIIPIFDMQFLWDYFHFLPAAEERAIHESVIADANRRFPSHRGALQADLLKQRERYINEQLINLRLNTLRQRYQDVYPLLYALCCPPGQDASNNNDFCRKNFAWAPWNLFKGWGHRTDDPKNDGSSRSEKNKPLTFNQELWSCLVDERIGLVSLISNLKRIKYSQEFEALRTNLLSVLKRILSVWTSLPVAERIIHSYKESEWEVSGYKEGRTCYRIKKVSEIALVHNSSAAASRQLQNGGLFNYSSNRFAQVVQETQAQSRRMGSR